MKLRSRQAEASCGEVTDDNISVHFGVGDAVTIEIMYLERCCKLFIKRGPPTNIADADRLVISLSTHLLHTVYNIKVTSLWLLQQATVLFQIVIIDSLEDTAFT